MTTKTQGTVTMEENTMGAAKDSSQEKLENTTHHQMIACCGSVDVNHHPVGNPKRKL
jgi:hypothetical protein